MTFATQYVICNMYFLSECFRSESNSDQSRWNIRWIFLKNCSGVQPINYFCEKLRLRCSTEFEYHPADSKPLSTLSKSPVADLFAN